MAPRPLVLYPDPRLHLPAEPVTAFDEALRRLAADLLDTLRHERGLGLTAPHVGVPRRVVVLGPEGARGTRVYVNPSLLHASPETARHLEGSLSMPGVSEEVERPARVTVRYQDLDGATHEEEAEGFRAACHAHEIDQLDGVFWLARLSRVRRERAVKRYQKLRRG